MQKKIKEIKQGEVFTYAGYEWIKLEQEWLCLMKNILEQRAFGEVNNDWRKSELRQYLNNVFYENLIKKGADEKDFLMIETDLTADDGMKDYGTSKDLISLMTADLYRKNRHLLNPTEDWWWLATPHSCQPYYSRNVGTVYFLGVLERSQAHNSRYGVRPVCKLAEDTPVDVPDEKPIEQTEAEKEDITELIKKWAEENNLTQETYNKHIYRLIRKISDLTRHIEGEDYNEAKHDLGYIYAKLVILAKKLSGTDDEDFTSFLINEIEAGRSIW